MSAKLIRIMYHQATTINDYTSIAEVKQLLLDDNIHRLPKVEVRKSLGIITRYDLPNMVAAV